MKISIAIVLDYEYAAATKLIATEKKVSVANIYRDAIIEYYNNHPELAKYLEKVEELSAKELIKLLRGGRNGR